MELDEQNNFIKKARLLKTEISNITSKIDNQDVILESIKGSTENAYKNVNENYFNFNYIMTRLENDYRTTLLGILGLIIIFMWLLLKL
ncbi:hypothetical protein A0H76_538 [Hepatospora eriocheir]|uniref:t-SNARE coiled-coil homology domain-containing protein n=1 Tax=Hepatospora eriocheir TaxID=1081669 RepID=A0A1X0Q8E0_9MICR|nr:hypothetical protein A0H76_538 [Hepatospora eriocheir]